MRTLLPTCLALSLVWLASPAATAQETPPNVLYRFSDIAVGLNERISATLPDRKAKEKWRKEPLRVSTRTITDNPTASFSLTALDGASEMVATFYADRRYSETISQGTKSIKSSFSASVHLVLPPTLIPGEPFIITGIVRAEVQGIETATTTTAILDFPEIGNIQLPLNTPFIIKCIPGKYGNGPGGYWNCKGWSYHTNLVGLNQPASFFLTADSLARRGSFRLETSYLPKALEKRIPLQPWVERISPQWNRISFSFSYVRDPKGLTQAEQHRPTALIIVPSNGNDVGAFRDVARALNRDLYKGQAVIVKTVLTDHLDLQTLDGASLPFADLLDIPTLITLSHAGPFDGPNLAYGSGGNQPWAREGYNPVFSLLRLSTEGDLFWRQISAALRPDGKIILAGCYMGDQVSFTVGPEMPAYAALVARTTGRTAYGANGTLGAADYRTMLKLVRAIEAKQCPSPMRQFDPFR